MAPKPSGASRGGAKSGKPTGAGKKSGAPKSGAARGAKSGAKAKSTGSYVRGANAGDGTYKKGKIVGEGSSRGAGPRAKSAGGRTTGTSKSAGKGASKVGAKRAGASRAGAPRTGASRSTSASGRSSASRVAGTNRGVTTARSGGRSGAPRVDKPWNSPREDDERGPRVERVERELGGEQIEGRQALREVLRAGRRRVKEIFVAEDLEESEVLDEIINLAQVANVPIRELSRGRLDRITKTEIHQGVMAYVSALHEHSVADLIALAAKNNTNPFLICMDSITDPHNLGTTLRTALCAGATGVVLPRNRGALVTATTAKAAAGAIEYLPIAVVPGIPSALSEIAKAKVWTVGLDGDAKVGLYDKEFAQLATDPIALVLGAEGRGLSELSAKRCDMLVKIPQSSHLDSLNVSAASAVAAFEIARLRGTFVNDQ